MLRAINLKLVWPDSRGGLSDAADVRLELMSGVMGHCVASLDFEDTFDSRRSANCHDNRLEAADFTIRTLTGRSSERRHLNMT